MQFMEKNEANREFAIKKTKRIMRWSDFVK